MKTTNPWTKHQDIVKRYIDENGYSNILREPTVKGTMFVGYNETTIAEWEYIVQNKDYDFKWRNAIKDDGFGNPERFPLNDKTSGNYIHCAYHLAKFEELHGVSVKDLNLIFEVGAGYGAMAKVCKQAGFNGTYVLMDLPIFSELQKNYLKTNYNYEFIQDIKQLNDIEITKESLFISTWAVSEMPEEYREGILIKATEFNNILLAYQSYFEGMDIYEYFDKWKEKYSQFVWINTPCMDENHKYLFGRNFYE
jgi:hypothetical protein